MTTTTTVTRTAGTALLAATAQATATVTVGSAVDVSSKLGPATAFVKMGRTVTTALGNEVTFRLEGSAKTSGNDEWVPIYTWTSATGKTACHATTLNGATTAGNTTSAFTSGTGFAAGGIVFCYETGGSIANSEWSRIAGVSTNTITWEEAQTRNHTNGIAVCDYGEEWAIPLDLSGHVRVRLVVDSASAASGQTVVVLGWLVTADSASSA